jgi:P4 family phage/plasmid primase-like protien
MEGAREALSRARREGDGGYSIICGRNSKGEYTWLRDPEPFDLALLPTDLREFLGLLNAPEPLAPRPTASPVDAANRPTGDRILDYGLRELAAGNGRNNAGFLMALQLRDNGYSESDAGPVMSEFVQRCPPTNTKGELVPFDEGDGLKILASVYTRAAREAWKERSPRLVFNAGKRAKAGAGATDVEDPDLAALLMQAEAEQDPERRTAALQHLAAALASRGALEIEHYAKAIKEKGLAGKGPFLKAVDEAQKAGRAEPGEQVQELTERLAAELGAVSHFARDEGGRLWRYEAGVYHPDGAAFVKRRVKELLADWGEEWRSYRAEETIEYLRVDAPELWTAPPLDVLNVKNGLLNVRTRELLPHSPEHLSPVQIPVDYDPKATCAEWDEFVKDVFPDDAQELAWEIAAWLMLPDTSIQKAVLLTGEGANGKSAFLAALKAFLGRRNCAAKSLHRLELDKFAVAGLLGKLANICPDLPSEHLSGTSVFKAITGGDMLDAERKFADAFEFTPFCRLVFSCNHPPRSQDGSPAFFRRWLVVPFTRTFEEGAEDCMPRAELDAILSDPKELSGVLNKALAALPNIEARGGLLESRTMTAAWEEFLATTEPFSVWLDQHTVSGPELVVSKQDLVGVYNRDASSAGRPYLTDKAVGKLLRRLRPQAGEAQRTYQGRDRVWCWVGIGLGTVRTDAPKAGGRATAQAPAEAPPTPQSGAAPEPPGVPDIPEVTDIPDLSRTREKKEADGGSLLSEYACMKRKGLSVTSVTSGTHEASGNGAAAPPGVLDWQTFRESLFLRARGRGYPEVAISQWSVGGEKDWGGFCSTAPPEYLHQAVEALDALREATR